MLLTLFRMGGKESPINFSSVTSANLGISSKQLRTFGTTFTPLV